MGNLCSWCKNITNSEQDENIRTSSQTSLTPDEVNDRTPLLSKSASQHQYNQSVIAVVPDTPTSLESSSLISNIVPPLPPPPSTPLLHTNQTETISNRKDFFSGKVPSIDSNENSMAVIFERMLPDLIDVGGWGTGVHQNNSPIPNLSSQNEQLKQQLSNSLQSIRVSSLPDVGTPNLPTLLSNRPISPDICHFVAHTAGELSRLLIDEIKIVHKEDLVVTFE